MTSYRSWIAVLMVMIFLAMAGSLPAENKENRPSIVPQTMEGGSIQPVRTFDLTPVDVLMTAPLLPPPQVATNPYTEKSPLKPEDYNARVEIDDDGPVSKSGVSKMTLYLEKEQLPPMSVEELRQAEARGIPRNELPSDAMGGVSRALANPFLITSGSIDAPIPDGGWYWRRVIDDAGNAPAGAVVTNLEYRLRITHYGDPATFYCGDYEIHLFSGVADRELMIYDNLGGRTDGDFDDDVEDDADIYLDWRNIHFFDGDNPSDWFGVWIDDVYSADSGLLNYIEFYVHWELPLPNLTCHTPSGWDSSIVVSSVTGTTTTDSLTGDEPAYIDWSVINNGSADVAGQFYTALYIDGNYITQWFTDNLGANWWAWVNDYAQTLPAGDHEVCIVADYTDLIAEENENDNSCCFTYTWYPAYVPPDLHCYSPGWDGPIVVSNVRGTSTQDTIRLCDTAFVDWAVGNSGGAPTADRYYIRLLVDGTAVASWFKDAPHDNGFYIWQTDHPLMFATAGTHVVSLEIDYTDAISEGNENNNSCELATMVIECFDPDVACFQIDGWDGPIVVSGVPGGTTQGPVTVGETAYIDFGVANIGNAATTVNIYHNLYIDGDSTMTWFSTPINPGDFRWVADYPFTFATSGPHTVRLFHDATDAVVEPNEVDNICEITVNVQPASFLIAGRINDPGGGYIQGVSVDFSDVGAVVTDPDGYYEQAVPSGWSGRATPSKACLEFLPPYRDYVNVTAHVPNQHYEGSVAQYAISGQVANSAGAGIADVNMTGFPGEVYTDANGNYTGTIPCGWSGTITPVLECWGFSPSVRAYTDVRENLNGHNYLAIPVTYTLSGHVRDATGAGVAGVTMNGSPCSPPPATDADGFYLCGVPCGWSGVVTPSGPGCTFTPTSRTYTNFQQPMTAEDYLAACQELTCDLGFDVDTGWAGNGQAVEVPIFANGLGSQVIGGLEFHLSYPVGCLSFDAIVSPYLTSPTVNGVGGELHIVWEDFANPITVPNGAAIAKIQFTVLGNEGDTCEICWLTGNEVVDPIGDPIARLGYCCGAVVVEQPSLFMLQGNVVYYDMVQKLPDVQINLTGGAVASTTTDNLGRYAFADLSADNYVVTPAYNADDPGVSVADIIKIRRHLAALTPFTSGYQMLAGDITCDCRVSVSDIIKMRRYLAVLDTLPCGNWTFVDSSFAIDLSNWCSAPSEISTALAGDQSDSSFVGVRLGDVNASWTPPPKFATWESNSHATADAVTLALADVRSATKSVSIPVSLGRSKAAGVELHLKYDSEHLSFTGFDSELMSDATVHTDGQNLHVVWEDLDKAIELDGEQVVATLEFEIVRQPSEFTEVEITSAEVVDESGAPYSLSGRNSRIFVSGGAGQVLPGEFSLGQNYPNPFNPETDIDFYLPHQADVTLTVYNMIGQQVQVLVSSPMSAGIHTVSWNGRDESGRVVSSGIYLYRLNANEFTESRKMLMLK